MSKKIFRAQYDTRGLPLDMDPMHFYKYRAITLAGSEDSTFVERALYKLIPFKYIESFAIAIDPMSNLKMSSVRITPANRIYNLVKDSTLNQGKVSTRVNTKTKSWTTNSSRPAIETGSDTTTSKVTVKQQPLRRFRNDTTSKTRLWDSDLGEFEKYDFTLANPQLDHYWSQKTWQVVNLTPTSQQNSRNQSYYERHFNFFGTLPRSTHDGIILEEQLYAASLIRKHALGLYKQAMPGRREYSLFRNIAELKDVPRSIISMRDTVGSLSALYKSVRFHKIGDRFSLSELSSRASGEILSYKFGWEQLIKDLNDILEAPARVTRRINRMIARSGKETRWTSRRKISSGGPSPSFNYSGFPQLEMYSSEQTSHYVRETELRVVLNAKFNLPSVEVPDFQTHAFLRALGVEPTFTDFYNLIPWTWLVDWYGGIANYLEIVDTLNKDPNLINCGFITASSKRTDSFDYKYKVKSRDDYEANPPYYHTLVEEEDTFHHRATLESSYQIRMDLSSYAPVNSLSVPGSLTQFQQTILGALLFQRLR